MLKYGHTVGTIIPIKSNLPKGPYFHFYYENEMCMSPLCYTRIKQELLIQHSLTDNALESPLV